MNGHQIISKYTQNISNCCWYLLVSFGCFASWTPFSILKLHWALESMLWSEAWAAKPGWFANHGHTVIHVIRVIGLIRVRTLSSWWSVGVCVCLSVYWLYVFDHEWRLKWCYIWIYLAVDLNYSIRKRPFFEIKFYFCECLSFTHVGQRCLFWKQNNYMPNYDYFVQTLYACS